MRTLRDINFIPIDLESIELPEDAYDLIACFRYLDRKLIPAIRAAMKPGGLIVYQTFNVHQLERFPDCNQDYLLEPRELPSHFPGWQILHDEERGEYSFLVARKPQSLGGMP